jgi:Flp pilus assembly protein TadG
MRVHLHRVARDGATTVEFAVVSGIFFFLIFALLVGASGIFRYQEVAHLAREAARYSSTHGGQYQLDGIPARTGVPAINSSSDLTPYVLSKAVLLDPSKVTVSVNWSEPAGYTPQNMPSYVDTNPNLVPPGQKTIQNYVTVTVTYQWMPEVFLFGPITLTSTSVMPMSY